MLKKKNLKKKESEKVLSSVLSVPWLSKNATALRLHFFFFAAALRLQIFF